MPIKANPALNKAYSVHKKAYSALNKAYSALNKAYSALNKAYSALNKVYSALNKVYSALNKAYSALNKAYSALNKVYSALNKAYSALTRLLPSTVWKSQCMPCRVSRQPSPTPPSREASRKLGVGWPAPMVSICSRGIALFGSTTFPLMVWGRSAMAASACATEW